MLRAKTVTAKEAAKRKNIPAARKIGRISAIACDTALLNQTIAIRVRDLQQTAHLSSTRCEISQQSGEKYMVETVLSHFS